MEKGMKVQIVDSDNNSSTITGLKLVSTLLCNDFIESANVESLGQHLHVKKEDKNFTLTLEGSVYPAAAELALLHQIAFEDILREYVITFGNKFMVRANFYIRKLIVTFESYKRQNFTVTLSSDGGIKYEELT